jgi:predicted nucleotidyltransferase
MGITMPIIGMAETRTNRSSSSNRKLRPSTVRSGTSLADALFTATQQRVLGLLFGQPDRSFFANELISLARAGSGGVQRELKRLADSGLVTVFRVGNQKHYQANRSSPVFGELYGIVRKTVGLRGPIRDALMPLADRIEQAVLYGSVAKQTDTASSDIDLLVVSDSLTLEKLYAALAPVEEGLARKINPTLYTVREFEQRRKKGSPFLKRVLAGEHTVLVGDDPAA